MRLSASQYAEALVSLSGTEDPKGIASSFLSFIRRNRAMRKIPAILRLLGQLSDEKDGRLALVIETAREADPETKAVIESEAAGFFPGKRLMVRYVVQPDLLGGVRISSYHEMVDATVQTRLRTLESRIMG